MVHQARKIEEHKRKKERKAQEKLEHEKQERLRKAREAAKAREENTRTSQTDAGNSGIPGDFYQFLKDPEVLQAFQVSDERKLQSLISQKDLIMFVYSLLESI